MTFSDGVPLKWKICFVVKVQPSCSHRLNLNLAGYAKYCKAQVKESASLELSGKKGHVYYNKNVCTRASIRRPSWKIVLLFYLCLFLFCFVLFVRLFVFFGV